MAVRQNMVKPIKPIGVLSLIILSALAAEALQQRRLPAAAVRHHPPTREPRAESCGWLQGEVCPTGQFDLNVLELVMQKRIRQYARRYKRR